MVTISVPPRNPNHLILSADPVEQLIIDEFQTNLDGLLDRFLVSQGIENERMRMVYLAAIMMKVALVGELNMVMEGQDNVVRQTLWRLVAAIVVQRGVVRTDEDASQSEIAESLKANMRLSVLARIWGKRYPRQDGSEDINDDLDEQLNAEEYLLAQLLLKAKMAAAVGPEDVAARRLATGIEVAREALAGVRR